MDDLSSLAASHPSPASAFHAMARSRAQFVDLAGFFCYCREAFVEFFDNGELDQKYPPSNLWTPWVTQKKTGYLINLPPYWRTHNIPMWLAHNIPVHYPWEDETAVQPRFTRLDPEFLQAHDEDVLGPLHTNSAHSVFFEVQDEEEFDEWLQTAATPGYNSPHQVFSNEDIHNPSYPMEFLFRDYEDWAPRLIDNILEASFLSEIFYFRNKLDAGTLRRQRQIFGYRPRKEDTPGRIGILLPGSSLNFPYSHREQYKFVYATVPVEVLEEPSKTLLERLNLSSVEEGEIVTTGRKESDDSQSISSASRSSRRRGEFGRDKPFTLTD